MYEACLGPCIILLFIFLKTYGGKVMPFFLYGKHMPDLISGNTDDTLTVGNPDIIIFLVIGHASAVCMVIEDYSQDIVSALIADIYDRVEDMGSVIGSKKKIILKKAYGLWRKIISKAVPTIITVKGHRFVKSGNRNRPGTLYVRICPENLLDLKFAIYIFGFRNKFF